MEYILRDKNWQKKAKELMKVSNIRKKIEEHEEKLRKTLIDLSDNMNSKSGIFTFTKVDRKGSIDYGSIPLLASFDMEPFRRPPTVAWLLRLQLEEDGV